VQRLRLVADGGDGALDSRVDLVGLAGERGQALDLLGVGDLDRPASCSSVSWTRRAPVIDSTTAQTGWPWSSAMRWASVLSESTSGGTRAGQMLSITREQTDVDLPSAEIQSGVQH
jgi:hypothetical protein